MRQLSGREAVAIYIEEIGSAIGQPRLREFERKVRARLRQENAMAGAYSSSEWVSAMAHVIVEDDDSRADQGFRRATRRIRKEAGERSDLILPG